MQVNVSYVLIKILNASAGICETRFTYCRKINVVALIRRNTVLKSSKIPSDKHAGFKNFWLKGRKFLHTSMAAWFNDLQGTLVMQIRRKHSQEGGGFGKTDLEDGGS